MNDRSNKLPGGSRPLGPLQGLQQREKAYSGLSYWVDLRESHRGLTGRKFRSFSASSNPSDSKGASPFRLPTHLATSSNTSFRAFTVLIRERIKSYIRELNQCIFIVGFFSHGGTIVKSWSRQKLTFIQANDESPSRTCYSYGYKIL